jgi:hypothetical protein
MYASYGETILGTVASKLITYCMRFVVITAVAIKNAI